MKKTNQLSLKAVLSCLILAGGWILFSDERLNFFVSNPVEWTEFPIIKNWGLVILTGVLWHQALKHWLTRRALEADKRKQAGNH